MEINIKPEVDKARRYLTRFERNQLPYATSRALNDTAVTSLKAVQSQMKRNFDNPRPSTIKGVRVQRSHKTKLTAVVYVADYLTDSLKYQIEGGTRRARRKALAIPVGLKTNRYGNIPRGKLTKLINDPNTFVGEIEGVPGIWDRKTGRLLVYWNPTAQYRPRLPFYRIVKGVVKSRFDRNFRRHLKEAIRTAR